MSELKLQSDSFIKIWNQKPHLRRRIFAINQNAHNKIKGALNKSMGVIAGVADMCYIIQDGVIWIEWKFENGSQSKEQKAFQDLVESFGHKYFIVRSYNDFLDIIEKFE